MPDPPPVTSVRLPSKRPTEQERRTVTANHSQSLTGGGQNKSVGRRIEVDAVRSVIRGNLSMGLVIVSLIAELLFVVLLGYGIYRIVDVLG